MNRNSTMRTGPSNWNLSSVLRDLTVVWRLFVDPSVPSMLKILLPALALIYWISPLDLLPGLPFDDIAVVFILARFFLAMVPKDTLNRAYGKGPAPQPATPQPDEDQSNVVDTTWRIIDDQERR